MRRLIRVLIVGGLVAAAWALLRELMDSQPSAPPETAATEPERTGGRGTSNGSRSVSKAELYRQAQELDVEGRSKMTKEELAAAVAAARGGNGS
jgi:hypothetical protein